ncbi:MAG: glycosyltransferase [Clostridia bacterium]
METPEISVIVPVYKVEKYLHRCVDSILNQTFTDLEIILVDDGSPDRCGEICDEYARKDSRVRVIHKENGGVSDARNAGLKVVKGRFIGFVDSDDFIEPEMYAVLYQMIQKENADIAVCGVYNCFGSKRTAQYSGKETFVCDGKNALAVTLEGKKMPASLCNKLYRNEIFQDRAFLKDKTYEDAFFLPSLFLAADKVVTTTEPYYNYWHRSNSITTSSYSEVTWDVIDAYKYTCEQVEKYCPELADIAQFRLYWAYFIVLDHMLLVPNYKTLEKYPEVVRFLKQNWRKVFHCRLFRKGRRISVLALKCNVKLYRLLSIANSQRMKVSD